MRWFGWLARHQHAKVQTACPWRKWGADKRQLKPAAKDVIGGIRAFFCCHSWRKSRIGDVLYYVKWADQTESLLYVCVLCSSFVGLPLPTTSYGLTFFSWFLHNLVLAFFSYPRDYLVPSPIWSMAHWVFCIWENCIGTDKNSMVSHACRDNLSLDKKVYPNHSVRNWPKKIRFTIFQR